MSGNSPQHWSIRAMVIFVAVVGLIANVIAIIVFVTGRGSLPAFFSTSTSTTTLTPTSPPVALSNPTSPAVSSTINPLDSPWVWIWWGFLTAVLSVLVLVSEAQKGKLKAASQAYVGFFWLSLYWVGLLFIIDLLIHAMANNWFAAFIVSVCFTSLVTIYQIIKVVARE